MKMKYFLPLFFISALFSCQNQAQDNKKQLEVQNAQPFEVPMENGLARAYFASGCFWCVESDFEKVDGVVEAISGYTGGQEADPTYEQVSSGRTGHVEAIKVTYDPDRISYQALLDHFWRHVDPTDAGGQFVDRGSQYRPAIFYHDEAQRAAAEQSLAALAASGRYEQPIVTPIRPAESFYQAEDYHQNYYKENPVRYKFYRYNSGRDQFINRVWGKDES